MSIGEGNSLTTTEAINDAYMLETSNYATLGNKSWYVDKTLFIKAVFKDSRQILISAPRRFGKSTNMDMLKTFFEIEMDHNGQRVSLQMDEAGQLMEQQASQNFNLFTSKNVFTVEEDGKQAFDKTFFTDHFGRYPTIYVDFKNVKGNDYDQVLASLRTAISKSFLQHSYLMESNIWSQETYEKSKFTKYININQYETLSEEEIKGGLTFLSQILCAHFKGDRMVYVFIDEYDAPISNAMFNKDISESDLDRVVTIIRALVSSLLKSNPFVERALLNACHHVGEVLSPDTSNIIHRPFMQSKFFCDFYGFTGDEVEQLLKSKGLSDKIKEVKERYSGYSMKLFGGNYVEIYSTWSIINYLCENELRN